MAKIDLDIYEKIIYRNILKQDSVFLASCVEHLDKTIFRDKNISPIIQIIKDFYIEHDTIPNHTEIKGRLVTSELKTQFKNSVDSIMSLDNEYNRDELIKNTEYFLKQRHYENLINAAVLAKADKKEFDADEIQKQVEKINSISLIDNLGLDYFGDNERVIEYLSKTDNFLSTGYKGLDDAFGGGFMKEGRSFYVFGGETNVVKSILLGNVITNAIINDLNVVLYTLEMSEARYAKRISGMLTGIALSQLNEKISNYKEFINDFISTHKSKLIIKEFPTKSVNAKQLYAYTERLKRKKKIDKFDLMAFDYHGLLNPVVKQPSKHDELQRITQECRGMTYLEEAPGVSVTQLNRSSHKSERPGLDSVAGSWNQNSDVDGHVNLAQTDEDREANIIRYHGEKARDGAKGKGGILKIDYNTLRLMEPNDDQNTTDDHLSNMDEIDFASLISGS